MKGLIIPSLLILTTGLLVETASTDFNRDATTAERTRVEQVLKDQGCLYFDNVDVEPEYYKAEDVVCNDGKKYDIILDRDMNIVSQ